MKLNMIYKYLYIYIYAQRILHFALCITQTKYISYTPTCVLWIQPAITNMFQKFLPLLLIVMEQDYNVEHSYALIMLWVS